MSLFGSLMADVEDDSVFGSHMRHMRQMNNMVNSFFYDYLGGTMESPLSIMGARRSDSLMPFMPPMPSLNRLFSATADMSDGHMGAGTSFSSSTVVMSSGLNGNPQVYSSSSSTKIGPNGVKETRKTLQDSRTGVKKMSIGHHIGERAHVIEREQNVYSGDAEERQEFINVEEDEAEEFDREFQERTVSNSNRRARPALAHYSPLLALPAAPSHAGHSNSSARRRPQPRRPLHAAAPAPAPQACEARHSNVREVYGGAHPQRRHRHRYRHSPTDTCTNANTNTKTNTNTYTHN